MAAPSSAGPAPSRLQALPDLPTPEPIRRPAHKRWPKRPLLPTNVGVDPQQRVYSLVMLLTLAAVVGVVGAGLLVAIVFITIGALGG